MELANSTNWNISTYIITFFSMIVYIVSQIQEFYKYRQQQKELARTIQQNYATPPEQDYTNFHYKNSIFTYLDENNQQKLELQVVTQDDQSSDHQEKHTPLVSSKNLSHLQDNLITQRNITDDNPGGIPMNEISRTHNSKLLVNSWQVQQDGQNCITTNPNENSNGGLAGQITDNLAQKSEFSSSGEDDDDDDDEDDNDEEYDDFDNYEENRHLKENPKGQKYRYKQKSSLLSGYQTYVVYQIFNIFSLPIYCLILLGRDLSTNSIFRVMLSVFSLVPSFTITFSIIFFACIVQNQGIFLKLKDESSLGDSKISNRDENSEDNQTADSGSNSTIGKRKEYSESERKIFVKHCLKRGVITGLVFAMIQCGILIYCFCSGEYDPKFIMMNPLLILIKSINYLHISFTQSSSYSNQAIQTQKILYQYYTNFYSKHLDYEDICKEFLDSQKSLNKNSRRLAQTKLQNEQSMEEFRLFLESKSYLALQDFKQKEINIENQVLQDIISNQGLKAQLWLQGCSKVLLTILPMIMLILSVVSTLSLIRIQYDYSQVESLKDLSQSQDYYQIPSYVNIQGNSDNVCSIFFNFVIIIEYIVLLRIKYLLNIKVILNTTKDPKKYE